MKILVFEETPGIDTALAFVDNDITDTQKAFLLEDFVQTVGPGRVAHEIEITSTYGNSPLELIVVKNCLYISGVPVEFGDV